MPKNHECISGKSRLQMLITYQLIVHFWCSLGGYAYASTDQTAAKIAVPEGRGEEAGEYHTPLAGERAYASFMGQAVVIPAQDRSRLTSLTVGGSLLQPKQGGTMGVPIAALYLRRIWEDARTRDVVSLFVNELEYDKGFGRLELVGHFENYTIPGDHTELQNNREVRSTSLSWGSLLGSLGPGVRFPVAPFQVDNDFRLQLLGRVGYFYAERTDDSGADVLAPPSTMLYGVRLRGRYDGLRRNMLELPHHGLAAGFDLDYLARNNWRDLTTQSGTGHRDYYQASGYLLAASGIPGLSERNRALLSVYGGKTREGRADRFNAFLINGGSSPSEADDLGRPHYSGITYDYLRASEYLIGSLAYRRELAFFLYLSVVGSYIWADRTSVQGVDQVVFRERRGTAATVSLDSAFYWDSELYLGYSWESGFIREGKAGNGITVNWNKSF